MYRVSLKSEPSEADEIAERAKDLEAVDRAIERAVVAQNRDANFRPSNRHSVLNVRGSSGEIGSRIEGYAERLTVDEEEIADIQERWIVDGER